MIEVNAERDEIITELSNRLMIIDNMKVGPQKDEFYQSLVIEVKDKLGQTLVAAPFYYSYASYLFAKIKEQTDIFGGKMIKGHPGEDEEEVEVEDDLQQIADDLIKDLNQPEITDNRPEDKATQAPNQKLETNVQKQEGKATEVPNQQGEVQTQVPLQGENTTQAPVLQQKGTQAPNQQGANQDPENEQYDDQRLCYETFQLVRGIYATALANKETQLANLSDQQIADIEYRLAVVMIDIGDFYQWREQSQYALQEYNSVLRLLEKDANVQSNRMYAEVHYLIGVVYACQHDQHHLVLQNYLKSTRILINHLEQLTHIPIIDKPSLARLKVNPVQYLPASGDSQVVIRTKESLLEMLKKLVETEAEIEEFAELERVREEHRRLAAQTVANPFGNPVLQTGPVTVLGTIGSNGNGEGNKLIRVKHRVSQNSGKEEQRSTPVRQMSALEKKMEIEEEEGEEEDPGYQVKRQIPETPKKE